MKKNYTMRQALEDPDLLGTVLPGDTWKAWRIILIAAMGEPLTFWERRTFKRFTGRSREPGKMVEELVAVAGRRAGKSRASSALAVYMAALVDHSDVQAVGKRLKLLFLARDQKQAGVCFGYVSGIFDNVPMFRELVINRTQDTISLSNGIDLEVKAASSAGVRGFSCVAVLADEAAHWTTDSASANADTEILNAVRPSLATTGGPLLILSSPFARKGEVFDLFDRHYGPKGDSSILVVHGASRDFNASLPKAVVDRALARNPIAGRAEWLAEFRGDLEGFVSLDTIPRLVGARQREAAMTVVGYARVSTQDQDLSVQLEALRAAGASVIYREKASGKSADGAQLARMLKQLRPGDCVIVTKIDRLGRGLRDLVNILHDLDKAGVGFRSIGDPWCDTRSPAGKLMLAVIGGLAEYERSLIVSRTSEGRKRAMALGVKFGRPPVLSRFQREEALRRKESGEPLSLVARATASASRQSAGYNHERPASRRHRYYSWGCC
jgi:DNA invertase Pin-like site-specific DNA recombinase